MAVEPAVEVGIEERMIHERDYIVYFRSHTTTTPVLICLRSAAVGRSTSHVRAVPVPSLGSLAIRSTSLITVESSASKQSSGSESCGAGQTASAGDTQVP